jgi:hypothetical protein
LKKLSLQSLFGAQFFQNPEFPSKHGRFQKVGESLYRGGRRKSPTFQKGKSFDKGGHLFVSDVRSNIGNVTQRILETLGQLVNALE